MTHYYSENQDSPLHLKTIEENLRDNDMRFLVASGVFSKSKVDDGSRVLIENIELQGKEHILDLGCGYGPVGIALARDYPDIKVSMTDTNKRALMLAKKNVPLNNLDKKRFEFFQGNSFEPVEEKSFDVILLNPPQTAGKKLCFSMVEDSINYLNEAGIFYLVARHKKGGQSFEKKMQEVFGNVEAIAKKKGFRVYMSIKKDN